MDNAFLEPLSVLLAIAYLLLAARQNLWCWACALGSSLLYVLNIFYAVMAVVGWWQWRKAGSDGKAALQIHCLPWQQHLLLLGGMLLLAFANGWIMERYSTAVWPYVDSFTTWASIFTTIMVIRKVLENWWYWLAIDTVSIYLYWARDLPLTALLFVLYVALIPIGLLAWRRAYDEQRHAAAAA